MRPPLCGGDAKTPPPLLAYIANKHPLSLLPPPRCWHSYIGKVRFTADELSDMEGKPFQANILDSHDDVCCRFVEVSMCKREGERKGGRDLLLQFCLCALGSVVFSSHSLPGCLLKPLDTIMPRQVVGDVTVQVQGFSDIANSGTIGCACRGCGGGVPR